MKANLIVIPLGFNQKPYFKHLEIENHPGKPANCVSSGKAMTTKRVKSLYEKGFSLGIKKNKPIFISESVPGGTTTAQAIMELFGLNVGDLIGSSMLNPPRKLKKELISRGLINADLRNDFDAIDAISAFGDPFQAFALGLLIGARKSNNKVILAGGSQMIAILLLALEHTSFLSKQSFADEIFITTTGWLVRDKSLCKLIDLVAKKHNVNLFGFASGLDFQSSKFKELKDYENGYVKEGVGAGGLSIIAYLKGFKYEEIVAKCEYNLLKMK